jgi:hypothetical protein
MHAQHVSDPQQGRHAGVEYAGLNSLIRGAADACGEEHRLLGAVLAEPFDADTVSSSGRWGTR